MTQARDRALVRVGATADALGDNYVDDLVRAVDRRLDAANLAKAAIAQLEHGVTLRDGPRLTDVIDRLRARATSEQITAETTTGNREPYDHAAHVLRDVADRLESERS